MYRHTKAGRGWLGYLAAAAVGCVTVPVGAQTAFPSKPVKIIVGYTLLMANTGSMTVNPAI